MSSEAQVKNFLISQKSYVPFSKYSSLFSSQNIQVFLTIPWFTKCVVMMSISTWDRKHFWKYLLNHNSLSHQTWPADRYKQGKYFLWIFFLFFFEKVNKGQLKMVDHGKSQLLKMTRSRYNAILIKSWKGRELVFSLQPWAKNMFHRKNCF